MEKTRNGNLIKNIVAFAFSNIAAKLVTFFLVPLYTAYLVSEEYGKIDLLFSVATVAAPLLTANIFEGILRFSIEKNARHEKIVSISICAILFSSIIGVAFIPILGSIEGYAEFAVLFYLYFVSMNCAQILQANLKGQEKLKLFSASNILNTLLIGILNIVFLKFCRMGIYGYFVAYIIANTITAFFSIVAGRYGQYISRIKIDWGLCKEMVRYSILLAPASIMWWIMNSSDSLMVTWMSGAAVNGLYAVSYKIPSIVITIASIFNQAWLFTAVKEKESSDKTEYNNRVFRKLFGVITSLSVIVLIVLKWLYGYYVAERYYDSWVFVPILLIGTIFMTMGTFVATTYNVEKNSKGYLLSTIFGALANIILNLIMIPHFGAYGAAIATSVSYILVFVYRVLDTRKVNKIKMSGTYIVWILILLAEVCMVYFAPEWKIFADITIIVFVFFYYARMALGMLRVLSRKRNTHNK